MRSLIRPIMAIVVVSGCMIATGCGNSDDASTPQVSSPPPQDPVPGMGESGSSAANQGGSGAAASPLKGPSND